MKMPTLGGEMSWLLFLIASLATFRVAEIGSSEEGPAAIFARLRRKVPPKTNPGRGIRCSRCWSVWIGMAATAYLVWLEAVPLPLSPFYAFALSGASVLLHKAGQL